VPSCSITSADRIHMEFAEACCAALDQGHGGASRLFSTVGVQADADRRQAYSGYPMLRPLNLFPEMLAEQVKAGLVREPGLCSGGDAPSFLQRANLTPRRFLGVSAGG